MNRVLIFFGLLISFYSLSSGKIMEDVCENRKNFENSVEIWPTIRSQPMKINNKLQFRLIQINWSLCKLTESDIIILFEKAPSTEKLFELQTKNWNVNANNTMTLFIHKPTSFEGIITTNISHKQPSIQSLAKGECVGAWIVFLRDRKIIKQACISSYPKWIWDKRSFLGDTPLPELILPGTHNSGSFLIEDSIDPVSTWIVCQDESILRQLLLGIRYLDLRVGYYPETEELLWINHDMVRWTPLQDILEDIKTFSFISPDPVIIDIHRTPVGFEDGEAALLLVSLLNNTLGEYLAIRTLGYNTTAKSLWRGGKTLIVSFGSPRLRKNIPWLWPPIFQAWANVQNVDDLKTYLQKEMKNNKNSSTVWVGMGHLTASMWDMIFNTGDGVRGWADKTGRPLSDWLKYDWTKDANIIAVDFFLSCNIIDLSIRLSLRKELCEDEKEEKCLIN